MPAVYLQTLPVPGSRRRGSGLADAESMTSDARLRVRGYEGIWATLIGVSALVVTLFVTIPEAHARKTELQECPGCLLPTDEIQVYDASITAVGKFNLTWHNNFTPQAQTVPDFPGGVVPDHTLNGVPEWAYGFRPWLELGAYVPIYSYTTRGQLLLEGVKLRMLFVVPHAEDRTFFYGLNFEYSYNEPRWDTHRFSGEMRAIIGAHLGPWDLIVNPVLDTEFNGFKNFTFAPEARVAYNFLPNKFALAAEWYGEFGAVSDILPTRLQGQNLFAVVDIGNSSHGIEFGVGHGYTRGSTPLIFKLMLMQDF